MLGDEIGFDYLIGQEDFVKLIATYPKAIFHKVKLRVYLGLVYQQ